MVSGTLIWPLNSLAHRPAATARGIAGSSVTLDLAAASRDRRPDRRRPAFLAAAPAAQRVVPLALREWDVAIPDLPEPLDGLRIVQLSDLHFAPCFERRFFEAGRRRLPRLGADLVVITGDLVEDDDTIAWIEPLLSPLEARLGKFAILGNHDKEHQPRTIVGELGRAGFEMLEGRWTTLDARRDDAGDRRDVGPVGPGVRPAATCRRPTSASC